MKKNYILAIILLAAFIIRIWNMNFNSAFMDEGLYILVGKLALDGNLSLISNPLYYMFGSYLVPITLGIANSMGGLIAARFLNVIFGIITILFIYKTTKIIFDKNSALFSAIISAIYAPLIFVSKFATYDMLSILFFSVSLYYLLKSCNEKHNKKYVIFSSVFLFLSFLAKYIAIIYFPLFLFFIFYKKRNYKLFSGVFIFLLAIYFTTFFTELNILLVNEFSWHLSSSDLSTIISKILYFIALPFILSIYGILNNRKNPIVYFLLVGASVAILYHIITSDYIALFKHINFSFIFLAPLIGFSLYKIFIKKSLILKMIFILILLVFVNINLTQLNYLEHFYPNSENTVNYMKTLNIDNTTKILVEGGAYAYYLYPKINPGLVYTTFWFDYNNNFRSENIDFIMAVNNTFFDYIILNGFYTKERNDMISEFINDKYKLVFQDNFSTYLNTGMIIVYKKI